MPKDLFDSFEAVSDEAAEVIDLRGGDDPVGSFLPCVCATHFASASLACAGDAQDFEPAQHSAPSRLHMDHSLMT